jgi:hypothetical protein
MKKYTLIISSPGSSDKFDYVTADSYKIEPEFIKNKSFHFITIVRFTSNLCYTFFKDGERIASFPFDNTTVKLENN